MPVNINVSHAIGDYVPISGGTITGQLTVNGNLTSILGSASILASGTTNTNTLTIKANDTTFITLTTGTTDVCTLAAVTMSGTWLASGTVQLPAFTAGGLITTTVATAMQVNVDTLMLRFLGGTDGGSCYIAMYGKSHSTAPGQFILSIPNAALGAVSRLTISGALNTVVATWAAITHTDFNLSDYLGLWKTDVDSAVEGELWYDDSENVLKYYNGTSVKTIATTA